MVVTELKTHYCHQKNTFNPLLLKKLKVNNAKKVKHNLKYKLRIVDDSGFNG